MPGPSATDQENTRRKHKTLLPDKSNSEDWLKALRLYLASVGSENLGVRALNVSMGIAEALLHDENDQVKTHVGNMMAAAEICAEEKGQSLGTNYLLSEGVYHDDIIKVAEKNQGRGGYPKKVREETRRR
jgi:hypothetical protein